MRNVAAIVVIFLSLVTCCIGQEELNGRPTPSPSSEAQTEGKSVGREVPNISQPTESIKWTDKAQAYSSILTLVVTIVGFSLLYFQINQAQKSLNGSTHAAIYGQQHAINQLFVDHPEFRKYFYDNFECPLNDKNRPGLLPVADMVADFFEHLTQQRSNLPDHIWPAWVRYMTYVYQNSPILREHYDKNGFWYDDDFLALTKKQNLDEPTADKTKKD